MEQVDRTLDLIREASPFDVLILYLLAAGFSQSEIAEMTYISRQAVNDRLNRLAVRYQTGNNPQRGKTRKVGRPRKNDG